jgi:putative spermidine/putrescine transport system permease protein
MKRKKPNFWAWMLVIAGFIYFFFPLYASFDFSLREIRGKLSFITYQNIFTDPKFYHQFGFSLEMAFFTIIFGFALVVPTAYWVRIRLPKHRPIVEFITLLPFVIPAVVLAFGLIGTYCCPPFNLASSPALLVIGYIILALPYMYRSVDAGLQAIEIRTLTEAAQSLGAGWRTILFRIILPNLRVAILSGAFLTFAICLGEFTLSSLFYWPAFGPYMHDVSRVKAYEPSALAVISFALTWGAIGIMQWVGGRSAQSQVVGAH